LEELGIFVAEGRLVVRRLIELRQWKIESILLTQPAIDNLADILPNVTAPIYLVDQNVMNKIAGFNIHRGCLALVARPATITLDRIAAGPLTRVLVLEGVNNPDNVGGLFRSAAAFGIELVVLGPNCGDPLYRKAVRTSMGATLSVPYVKAPQWPGAIGDLRADGFTVVAMTPRMAAAPLEDVRIEPKLALLVGAEGDGLTEEALRAATFAARIPMTPGIDSLNVTTAASIAMYHCFAERRSH
jgi:tRNA G18 (ribose-2'-O)-methylase SpoU